MQIYDKNVQWILCVFGMRLFEPDVIQIVFRKKLQGNSPETRLNGHNQDLFVFEKAMDLG